MDPAILLLLAVLLVIGVIIRFIYARRLVRRAARGRRQPAARTPPDAAPAARQTVRLPGWFTEFLKADFLNPAFSACTFRLDPDGDRRWRMNVIFKTARGETTRQMIDPVMWQELTRVDKALARIGWTLAGREGDLQQGLRLAYTRRAGAPTQAPPRPDPVFDTARVKAAQNWNELESGQIKTAPAGAGRWQVSVGFYAAQDSGRAEFDEPLTLAQIMKILADLKADGWRESRRIYYATHPGTPRYLGAITYVLTRE